MGRKRETWRCVEWTTGAVSPEQRGPRTPRAVLDFIGCVERCSRAYCEPVDALPFVEVVLARIAREVGEHGDRAMAVVLAEMGWTSKWGPVRWWYRLRHEGVGLMERAVAEDALEALGVPWWQVLDPPEVEAWSGWCRRCGEEVVVIDGCCAWCDARVSGLREAA